MKNIYKNSILIVSYIFIMFVFTLPIYVFAASPTPINLGTAINYTVLSESGISTTGTTLITGDIGVSPIKASALTGFSETMDSTNQFSTSANVVGKLYASDYLDPTPANLSTAVGAIGTAVTDANSRVADNVDLTGIADSQCVTGTCDFAGLTLAPSVYTFSGPGNIIITGDVTLNGSASDVWIFQIPGTLNISSGIKVNLTGGAIPSNVFWSVAGSTTLGTNSTFKGIIIEAGSVIALQTGATLNGRALSQFAVTLDSNTINIPTSIPAITLNSIAITTPATKLSYTVGDTLNISGLVVTGTYSDGSTSNFIVTPIKVSGFNSLLPVANQILTITINGKTTNYTVDIVAPVVITPTPVPIIIKTNGGGGHANYNAQVPAPVLAIVVPIIAVPVSNPIIAKVLEVPSFVFFDFLKKGISSNDIKELQERLRAEGFFTYKISTGYFGPITFQAVMDYQKSHQLPSTGFVGVLTIQELNNSYKNPTGSEVNYK